MKKSVLIGVLLLAVVVASFSLYMYTTYAAPIRTPVESQGIVDRGTPNQEYVSKNVVAETGSSAYDLSQDKGE
jgi:hypothetical protein